MNSRKLKLDQVEVESFATEETERASGTVEGHLLVTIPGQTILCTQCGNKQCGA